MSKYNKVTDIQVLKKMYEIQSRHYEKGIVQDENSKNYGQEVFKDIGYYTSLESCLKGIVKANTREYISKSEVNTLQELIQEIRNMDNYIKSLDLKI